jgi:hypothetical protein
MSLRARRRNILAIVTIALVIIFGGGIYFYYYFFRQVNAKLIETIPTDAAFMFQINDNEIFIKSTKSVFKHINPLFALDAYPGCQFFVDQLPGKYNQVVFSGHDNGDRFSILFACKIKERAFTKLLANLQIDKKNYTSFNQCKIYSYGTHLKRFVFTYHKGVFLASENIALLKKSITQIKNPRNLTTVKSFEALFGLMEKNKKQNWLVINHERYFPHFETFFNDDTYDILYQFAKNLPWAAYQTRFSGAEIYMTGYTMYYNLPPQEDTISFRVENQKYWSNYLSENGLKIFSVAQMNYFSFSSDSLTSKFQRANAIIKF